MGLLVAFKSCGSDEAASHESAFTAGLQHTGPSDGCPLAAAAGLLWMACWAGVAL